MTEKQNKPVFDYLDVEYRSSNGVRATNHNFLLGALFYDQDWRADLAEYVLGTEEYYVERAEKWLPSAYKIVMYATDEYDAMRKIVGSLEQWNRLKTLDWFAEWLDRALEEQRLYQENKIKEAMMTLAASGDKQAAKIVLGMAKPASKRVGRPKGKKNPDQKRPKDTTNDEAQRIVNIADRFNKQ